MAAIFQIRRGTTNVSLTEGELYLHQGSGSLQFGSGSNNYNVLTLNAPAHGDINLIGNISASGDIRLGGNIYLGDNLANDSVNVNSSFSGSILPSGSNIFDLGSTTLKYRNVYATSISGAIAATNGVISGSSQVVASLPQGLVSGSSQVIGILDSLNSLTGSYATTGSNTFKGNQRITGSLSISNGQFNVITGSGALTSSLTFTHNITAPNDGNAILELRHNNELYNDDIAIKLKADFAGAYLDYEEDTVAYPVLSVQSFANKNLYVHQDTRLLFSSLRIDENLTVTGSIIGLSGFTGSFSGSIPIQDGRLTNLESKSASVDISVAELNSYTSSLKTAITASGANVTINGNLTVKGTTTQIDSTTLNIGDNIIELNYGGSQTLSGIYTKDATGTLSSGSLLWNATTDRWIAGVSGSESTILLAGGDSVFTSSLQLTQINNTTASLNQTTASLNSFSASVTASLESIYQTTASLNLFSASVTASLVSVYQTTASLNTYTQSVNSDLASIHQSSASLNLFSASVTASLSSIYQTTASINLFTASVTSSLESIYQTTASLNSFTGSQLTQNTALATVTGSLIVSASQSYLSASLMTSSVKDHEERIVYLEGIGGISGGNPLTQLNIFSASAKISIENLNAATSSYETKGRSIVSSSAQITAFGFISSSQTINTASLATTGSNSFNGNQQITGSLLVSQNITGSASASFVSLAVNTTTPTQKIHLKGIVGIEAGTTGGNTADQIIFGYNGSGFSQYNHKIQTGHDAQAALNRMDFLLANSSNTWKTPLQLRPDIVYVSGSLIVTGSINGTINATNGVISGSSQILGASGIVSGSSQITYASISSIPSGIVSGAAQIPALLPSGVVSGSSQIITADSVTLGTHTAGNYVAVVSGSVNQITVAGSGLESAVVTLSLPQNIHTSADIQFNSLGIGTAASTVAGEIRATGDITAFYSSDIRLKENIVPIPNALEKVNQISGNTYDWKEGYEEIHSHKGNDVGVIAQEIEQILPQIVTNRDNGFKAVQYEKIVPLLIEAIKELSAKIKVLENK